MYHVFAEDDYYPQGGFDGYQGSRADLNEAISLGAKTVASWFEVLTEDPNTGDLYLVYHSRVGMLNLRTLEDNDV